MDKRIAICAAVVLAFGLIGFYLYSNYEIIPGKSNFLPIPEVAQNPYYALEKWLSNTGYSVNVQQYFFLETLANFKEETAVILDTNTSWRDTDKHLIPWLEPGRTFVISLANTNTYNNEESNGNDFLTFLSNLGITVGITPRYYSYINENTPSFHWRIKFMVDDYKDYFTIKDIHGNIRLVEVKIGDGALILIGHPDFMENHHIKKEINARLAWKLTGGRLAGSLNDNLADSLTENKGILFVRSTGVENLSKPLLGTLMQRGNLLPIGISIILLLIFSFWMVIPVFGLVLQEKQRTSRPIKERFAAEISFLKKYKGLSYYLNDNDLNTDYNYNDVIKKIHEQEKSTETKK